MKTLIIDNFDSFTYIICDYISQLGGNPQVFKNNEIPASDIEKNKYTHIIISPGPGTPSRKKDFGVCTEVIKKFYKKIPILGICLGHQGIAHVFGAKIVKAPSPVHGKQSDIILDTADPLFKNLPRKIKAMRYHSLIIKPETLPPNFKITAKTKDNLIMAISHKKIPLFGIQFHPESIGTPQGKKILKNFLQIKIADWQFLC